MNTRGFFNQILFGSLFVFVSCIGQVKNDLQKQENVSNNGESNVKSDGLSKLIKTQGTDEFANVYCSLMDKAGNLWFGTTGEGIYRYDGKIFTQFTAKDGLCNNKVWSIAEDRSGTIWFGTDDGISRYDGKIITALSISVKGGISFFPSISQENNLNSKNEVLSIMCDKKGTLWFGTRNGVFCYDGIKFRDFLNNDSIVNKEHLQLKMVDCIMEDKSGNIWFASGMIPGDEGICKYDGKTLSAFKPNGDGWIRNIIEAKDGNIYIATRQNGVYRYDGKNYVNFTKEAGINNGGVTTIKEDKAGNIWIGTELGSGQMKEDGGVWRFDGKSFRRFTTTDGLINNGVFSIVEDLLGNIWFGTRNVGLSKYDGKTFTDFSE